MDFRTPISAEPRSPFPFPSKPAHTNNDTPSDPRTSNLNTHTTGQETRDPRLLHRINTSHNVAAENASGASAAGSPSATSVPIGGTGDRGNDSAALPVIQRLGQITPAPFRNSSPSGSMSVHETEADPGAVLVTLLGSLFENASNFAVLKYEHNQVKAKADSQASLDRKMGNLSKTFPAFAETSSKARKDTEHDLALLDKKLSEHAKAQVDLLSALPNILHASRTPLMNREETDFLQRCTSVHEDFKSNVDDLREKFRTQQLATSELGHGYHDIGERMKSSTCQVTDLSSQMELIDARCFRLEGNYSELRDVINSSNSETASSMAALKNSLKQCTENTRLCKASIGTTTSTVHELSRRLGRLEAQGHTFSDVETHHAERVGSLEKLAENHSNELQTMKGEISAHTDLRETVSLMNRELQDLRQAMSDVQDNKLSTTPTVQVLSEVKGDIGTIKADLLELKKTTDLQHAGETGQELGLTNTGRNSTVINDNTSSKVQSRLTDCGNRLERCLEDIENIQKRLEHKQIEEDERDDAVATQVDDVRALIVKAQEQFLNRIEMLERDFQKQRAEDLVKTQKLEDSMSQLFKADSQVFTPRISPPSAPPTPQMHQIPQPQVLSNSPQPHMPTVPAELNRRLENIRSSLSTARQQLQAVTIAYQQLDRRYSNLSTEPIVRAMVHQMQLMYPYASEAQREIVNLSQTVEPLRCIPTQMENLKTIAHNHNVRAAGIENRIEFLANEKVRSDAKQEKLVELVKEERGKLIDEVNNQKEVVSGIANRLERLEEYSNVEPDKFEYLSDTLAKKLETQFAKTLESIVHRLDALDPECRRQELLKSFRGKGSRDRAAADFLQDFVSEDTDNSSIELTVKTKDLRAQPGPFSAPPKSGKTFLKPKPASNRKKRKRFGSQIDHSEDDDYSPHVGSSPARRKLRN